MLCASHITTLFETIEPRMHNSAEVRPTTHTRHTAHGRLPPLFVCHTFNIMHAYFIFIFDQLNHQYRRHRRWYSIFTKHIRFFNQIFKFLFCQLAFVLPLGGYRNVKYIVVEERNAVVTMQRKSWKRLSLFMTAMKRSIHLAHFVTTTTYDDRENIINC